MFWKSDTVEKMLSIRVCEASVILAGSKIWGKIKLDPRVSRKIEDSGSSGIVSKFTLKSPRRINCLFLFCLFYWFKKIWVQRIQGHTSMPIDYTNNYVGFIRINNFNKNRFKRFRKIKKRIEIMSLLKSKGIWDIQENNISWGFSWRWNIWVAR